MEYRRLGQTGIQISALSFGSWMMFDAAADRDDFERCLAVARDAGVNFLDNAEIYALGASEELMGERLARLDWPRDAYMVSSKAFFGTRMDAAPTQRGLSRKHLMEACHQALRRLRLDYLDLYFCHRPDPDTPVAETVAAMDTLVRQGKVLYWGTSEWPAERIAEARAVAQRERLAAPVVEQPEYNLFHRRRVEQEYRPLCGEAQGLGLTIWSPLASGVLSGKYRNGIPDGSRATHAAFTKLRERLGSERGRGMVEATAQLGEIAAELGCATQHLAIAWCLENPTVSTVLLGASTSAQLEDNLRALEYRSQLDAGCLQRIDAICAPLADRGGESG